MHKHTRLLIGAIIGTTFGLFAQDAVPPAAPVAAPEAVVAPAPAAVAAAPAAPAAEAPPAEAPAVMKITTISGTQTNAAGSSESQLISVTLDDVPLADVVKLFTKISGANIIAATTNLNGSVTANLQDVAWKPAFEAILERQGLLLVEKPANSGIFVVEARRSGEEIRVTDTVQLKFARVDNIAKLLAGLLGKEGTVTPFPEGNVILLQASQQKITEARKVIESLDRARSQVYIEARFVQMSAGASKKLGMKWDWLNAEKGWGLSVSGLKGGVEANSGEAARYNSGTTVEKTDQSIKIDTVAKDPTDTDPSTKPPIVTGTTFPYKKDVPLYTIPSAIGDAPGAGRTAADMAWKSASGVSGQIAAGDFGLLLNAFESIDGISIISNPKIIVANEEEATVDVTEKIPYVKVTANRSTSGGGNTLDLTTELGTIPGKAEDSFVGEAFFSYGITLKVTPRVSSTGTIQVHIEPTISDSIANYVIEGANADIPITTYPIIRMKRINTTFSMQDGATAVIGGLTTSSENNTDSGIPYLRKIPYIGPRLFGWKSRNKDQTELVIFVTVGIVDSEKPIDENIGMPKNAVLSRNVKEPGNGTKEDLMLLKP